MSQEAALDVQFIGQKFNNWAVDRMKQNDVELDVQVLAMKWVDTSFQDYFKYNRMSS